MPIGTPFHERTFALCESLNYREWSGYYTVSAYETHHEHEYNAIRNAAALIDISPLFKYRVTGKDATRLVDRIITRDLRKVSVGQVIYTPWCDEQGKVIDDGTVSRLDENTYRCWFTRNAAGLDVQIEDISENVAALALQGPTSGRFLKTIVADADIENLKYFRVTTGKIKGVPVEISRTGYTGDLGYEIWVATEQALKVWDVLIERGRAFDIKPAGMLALDVARIEAGLLLIDIDFNSSKKALIEDQKYSPFEMGLGRLVHLEKNRFVGQRPHRVTIPALGLDRPLRRLAQCCRHGLRYFAIRVFVERKDRAQVGVNRTRKGKAVGFRASVCPLVRENALAKRLQLDYPEDALTAFAFARAGVNEVMAIEI